MKYQDYVIKDGQFVGKFDEMYRDCPDPWKQSMIDYSISRNAAAVLMRKYGVNTVTEFGCGLGYYTEILTKLGFEVTGVDISPAAIDLAKQRWPGGRFVVGEVQKIAGFKSDAYLFAEITWYVLADLDRIFADLLTVHPGKLFVHNLVFYRGDLQRYGREYFTTPEEFTRFCPFKLLEAVTASSSAEAQTIETCMVFRIERP
jgi:SAM-dependent methyltransferase